jgi:transposase, IS5 family
MSKFIEFGNPGLFDDFVQTLDVKAFDSPLLRIGRLIDWSVLDPTIRTAILSKKPKGPGGRPRFDPGLMFKVLVLQRLHSLGDDDTCFQITDRNSFRAFLGLTPADSVPDGQTIRDFREDLIFAGAFEKLFATFLSHLQQKHGLALAKEGVMVDATFVEVPRQRNSREENAAIKQGEIPESISANPKRQAHKDTDARWVKKNKETYFGYKNHVKVDVVDKLIIEAAVTDASVHDSQVVEQLMKPGDKRIFADSAYRSEQIEGTLTEMGVESFVHEKGQVDRPLSKEQNDLNRAKSGIRSRVEHVFAQMTGSMKAMYQRWVGYERNQAGILMSNLVYNMMRFEQIVRLKLAVVA